MLDELLHDHAAEAARGLVVKEGSVVRMGYPGGLLVRSAESVVTAGTA